jgi:hypothetical protein
MAAQYVREVKRIWNLRRFTMAINAVKKIMNGDTPLASIAIDTGAIASGEIAASAISGSKIATSAISGLHIGASAVSAAKICASAVNVNGLKYGSYTFSLAANAVGAASAASKTFTVAITAGAKVLGHFINKFTFASTGSAGSVTIAPVLTIGTNSVKVSLTGDLGASDLVEGVLITIEP